MDSYFRGVVYIHNYRHIHDRAESRGHVPVAVLVYYKSV